MASTANGLPYPALSDSNNPPADLQALAIAVDAIYGKTAANAAALPASGAFAGQRIWLADVKGYAIWNGTSWGYPTAWATPTFANSWSIYSTAPYGQTAFRRASGSEGELKGAVKSGTTGTIFILPTGYRPAEQRINSQIANAGGARVDVLTTGEVQLVSYFASGTNAFVSLDGIRFPLA